MLRLVPILAASLSAPASGPVPPGPAPMTLEVVAVSENGPWKLVATNTGEEPLRFAADARLLSLEVTPPAPASSTTRRAKAPKRVTCSLPSALRPEGVAHDRGVLLLPGARWEEVFAPSLYCFEKAGREALVSGATVVAKLGFPSASRTKTPSAPFVAEPTRLDASVTAIKEIASEPFVLGAGDEPQPTPSPSEPPQGADPKAPRLAVTTPSHLDAANAANVVVSTSVRNVGMRSMLVHLRRDQLFFDVEGPTGLYRCGPEEAERAVPRDFFTTLKANGTRSFSVRLVEICPHGTFARPGLYRIRAGIAVRDGGADPRWGAYEGITVAKDPTLVRVRAGDGPFYLTHPHVIEAESAPRADAPAD